jgi:RNA polymerase sigma factor (TIGR02999 family)
VNAETCDPYSEESITLLLNRLNGGDPQAADQVLSATYRELRKIAARHRRRERPNHTLQPTALVHEAWIRFSKQPQSGWQGRAHFLAVASRQMRQILVDHARRRGAEKRLGPRQQTTLIEPLMAADGTPGDLLLVDELLQRLSAINPRAARIAELFVFGGMTFDEIALVLGTSARTAKRDRHMARAWWRCELSNPQ